MLRHHGRWVIFIAGGAGCNALDKRVWSLSSVIAKLVVLKNYVLRTTIYRMRS